MMASASAVLARECAARCGNFISVYATACWNHMTVTGSAAHPWAHRAVVSVGGLVMPGLPVYAPGEFEAEGAATHLLRWDFQSIDTLDEAMMGVIPDSFVNAVSHAVTDPVPQPFTSPLSSRDRRAGQQAQEARGRAAGQRSARPAGPQALRIEKTGKASLDATEEFGTHQVDYVLPVPGTRDRWLAVYFATLGGGNPDDQFAALLTSLFGAMMTTFRWHQEAQGDPA